MLFHLNLNTPQCDVFRILNNELLHFLQQSVNSTVFSEALFTTYQDGQLVIRSECWKNVPTKEKFEALWFQLPQSANQRQQLCNQITSAQTINSYFSDMFIAPPSLAGDLFKAFKQLTTHLFGKTASLRGVEQQAGSTVKAHFQAFRQANDNTQLCYLCGTSLLSQNRIGLSDNDQWRSDYDHVLCKDKYPIYAVHPGNFIPTCHICNSKAKGAIDLLFRAGNLRRLAFYPLPPTQESCGRYISVSMQAKQLDELIACGWDQPIGNVDVSFSNTTDDIDQKISVWVDTYQVPARVKAHLANSLLERLASDLQPRDFVDFKAQLQRYTAGIPNDIKQSEWKFWWFKLYKFFAVQNDSFLLNIWGLVDWKFKNTDQHALSAEFGI